MKKTLLVTISTADRIDCAKQLFSGAYFKGGWQGDYMLLAYEVPDKKLEWFRSKGILIKKCKMIGNKVPLYFHSCLMNTFYLFTPEFKKWDNIVYLDSDILIRASLEKLSAVKGFWAADDCRNLETQFINQKVDESVIWDKKYDKLLDELRSKYDLLRSAFNAGVIAFSTDIIEENTFNELNALSNKYMQIARLADQSILNLFFSKKWKRLPAVYNVFFVGPAGKKWLDCKKIRGAVIHLFAQNIPIKPEDCFYNEWMNNLNQANKICLDKRPFAKKRYGILESKLHFIYLIINCPRLIFWVFEIFLRNHLYYLYVILVKCKRALKKIYWRRKFAAKRFSRRLLSRIFMKRIDDKLIPDDSSEIRLFMSLRNEILRLPYILTYYRNLGVDRFFIVNNNSTDESENFLLQQPDVHVFYTKQAYHNQPYWIDSLLHRYGVNRWCLVVDADEIFKYPFSECINLKQLCYFLDEKKVKAIKNILLDMYSDKPMKDTVYQSGQDFLRTAVYYDKNWFVKRCKSTKYFTGGMRLRVFGLEVCLNKVSLLKFDPSLFLTGGTHYIEGTVCSSEIRGAILHFKYLHDFIKRSQEEVERKQHWAQAKEYKRYTEKIKESPNLNLYYENSAKYIDTKQLIQEGIMLCSQEFKDYAEGLKKEN
jgi:hypothetical protein